MNTLKISGLLFFIAGSLALMGIITAEATYPTGYSTFNNGISDLGSTKPPKIIIHQPSANIFNVILQTERISENKFCISFSGTLCL